MIDCRTRVAAHKHDEPLGDDILVCLCHFAMATIHVREGSQQSDRSLKVSHSFLIHAFGERTDHIQENIYTKACQSMSHFRCLYDSLQLKVTGHDIEGNEAFEDLTSKRRALLTLEFEAVLNHQRRLMKSDRLLEIVSEAQRFSSPRKTYALFADMVLLRACPGNGVGFNENSPAIPLYLASTVLSRIITAVRTLPGYYSILASRWIRCLIQLCLESSDRDGHLDNGPRDISEAEAHPEAKGMPKLSPLEIVRDLVNQATVIAQKSLEDRQQQQQKQASIDDDDNDNNDNKWSHSHNSSQNNPIYPAEEIEWLSTTLFNLGIDMYLRDISNDDQVHDQSIITTTTTSSISTTPAPLASAREWTTTALRLADLLARFPRDGDGGGDGGSLARLLRRKLREGGLE
jgi:hypothetical protein